MTATATPTPTVRSGRHLRNVELRLGLLAVAVTIFGYLLVQLADKADLPPDLWFFVVAVIGLYVLAHLAVRELAPLSSPVLLPIAAMLNGIGFITISRLDPSLARIQAGWMAAGVAAFAITLGVVRRIRTLERYRYTFLFLGVAALVMPLAPGIGKTINGAPVGRCRAGQLPAGRGREGPARHLLRRVPRRQARAALDRQSADRSHGRPHMKHLGPLLLAWAVSILIMVMQKDLGSSLLFFAVFTAMMYVATGAPRTSWPASSCSWAARRSRTTSSPTCKTA